MSEGDRNQKVLRWARSKLRQRVGLGECWDLADRALRHAGARSSTTTGRDDDYVWGVSIAVGAVIPGDILQFRDHVVTITTTIRTSFSDGEETSESFRTEERPHHTAVVEANNGAKGLIILEQNRRPGLPVERSPLFVTSAVSEVKTERRTVKGPDGKPRLATVVKTISHRVTGWVKAYRPQPVKP